MAIRFRILSALVLILVLTGAVIATSAVSRQRECVVSEAAATQPSANALILHVPLTDFFVIQRALMTLQDGNAAPALERLRQQVSEHGGP